MSGDQPPTQTVSWQSAVVAIAVIAIVGGIAITAIVKYSTVDEALKFWSALSGLVGLITGAFVTFFFSRATVQQAQQEKGQAIQQTRAATAEKTTALKAAGLLAGHMDKDSFQQLKESEPAVARAFNPDFT
jgi:enamine deaminase RidA (YjgF/YER057c/UK114 family)